MAKKVTNQDLQPYPREDGSVLAKSSMFLKPNDRLELPRLEQAIDAAFDRTLRNKKGQIKAVADSP